LFGLGSPIFLVYISLALVNLGRDGFTVIEGFSAVFLLLLVEIALYVIPIFFSTVYATKSGIHPDGLLIRKQAIPWDEIATVTRGRFGFPHDFAYIVSSTGRKLIIARSMSGYTDILREIESQASHLTPKKLPPNLWHAPPASQWRHILVFLGLFITYVVLRKYFDW
jgi:hypothetical protein